MDKHDEILKKLDRQDQTFRDHLVQDAIEFAQRPTKEEMKKIVHDALVEFFSNYGRFGYRTIIVVASLVVAIGVITGGFGKVLALFGLFIAKQ